MKQYFDERKENKKRKKEINICILKKNARSPDNTQRTIFRFHENKKPKRRNERQKNNTRRTKQPQTDKVVQKKTIERWAMRKNETQIEQTQAAKSYRVRADDGQT